MSEEKIIQIVGKVEENRAQALALVMGVSKCWATAECWDSS